MRRSPIIRGGNDRGINLTSSVIADLIDNKTEAIGPTGRLSADFIASG